VADVATEPDQVEVQVVIVQGREQFLKHIVGGLGRAPRRQKTKPQRDAVDMRIDGKCGNP